MKALNRIVTALLAIAVFPVAYFTDLITVYMHATIYDSNIVENLSVKRIIELFTGDGLFADLVKGGASELPDGLLKFKGNFIAFDDAAVLKQDVQLLDFPRHIVIL